MLMIDRKTDIRLATLFFILTAVFIAAVMIHEPFLDWTFDRHQNQLSWYIRPLFLIPFCYFAWRRSWSGVAITLFGVITSMCWFPRPEIVSSEVLEFLQYEKDFLTSEWTLTKSLTALMVPASLTPLAVVFWRRSISMGIAVLIFIAVAKITWSLTSAGESGQSIIIPAVIGLIVCVWVIHWVAKLYKE